MPRDIYISVVGTELVRLRDGRVVMLEDNVRVPSGVSYMLADRHVLKRVFPRLFGNYGVRSVDHYGAALLSTMFALAPGNRTGSAIFLLTPASTTRPTTSTPSSRGRWGSSWSRSATCSFTTTSSTAGGPRPTHAARSLTPTRLKKVGRTRTRTSTKSAFVGTQTARLAYALTR
ncbi:MAG TPA: circularly permuted type 2 ATP-grasp protein [Pyrinomonadaceae bacterium]